MCVVIFKNQLHLLHAMDLLTWHEKVLVKVCEVGYSQR